MEDLDGTMRAADVASIPDHERSRSTAYAAVTAHLGHEERSIAECVFALVGEPVHAAAGLLALIRACAALARFWAHAIGEEPVKAWTTYAEAVALGASRSAPPETPDRTDGR